MFYMLKRFDEMHEEIVSAQKEFFSKKITYKRAGPGTQVSSLELAQVRSLNELLEYAEVASMRLGAENEPTIHLPDFLRSRMMKKCEGFAHNFATSVYGELAERRSKYMGVCPVFKMCVQFASFLFPPLKTMSFKQALYSKGDAVYDYTEEESVKALHVVASHMDSSSTRQIYGACHTEVYGSVVSQPAPKTQAGVGDRNVRSGKRSLFNMENSGDSFTKPDDDYDSTLHWAQVEAEIDLYKKVAVVSGKMNDALETSFLVFWKRNESSFPNLARVSRLVYQVPASSVASERLFSAAGLIRSARRS
jgi:hAT family C-terminal dimerisation region